MSKTFVHKFQKLARDGDGSTVENYVLTPWDFVFSQVQSRCLVFAGNIQVFGKHESYRLNEDGSKVNFLMDDLRYVSDIMSKETG